MRSHHRICACAAAPVVPSSPTDVAAGSGSGVGGAVVEGVVVEGVEMVVELTLGLIQATGSLCQPNTHEIIAAIPVSTLASHDCSRGAPHQPPIISSDCDWKRSRAGTSLSGARAHGPLTILRSCA
jgi:hypothetical protein